MTKAKSKSAKSTVKATAAKSSVRKSPIAPATSTSPLIVLGFDQQQKPRGAKFVDAKVDLVTKAADLMGLNVYEATAEELAELAKKLPLGRLYANGRGFVPNIRQSLYSDLIAALAGKPEALLSARGNRDVLPPARGLPASWDEIGPGHLVIAHESLKHGWWEAIVIEAKNGSFRLQYRDFCTNGVASFDLVRHQRVINGVHNLTVPSELSIATAMSPPIFLSYSTIRAAR
jgi:hypothetical protein